jgi:hypothetical protein
MVQGFFGWLKNERVITLLLGQADNCNKIYNFVDVALCAVPDCSTERTRYTVPVATCSSFSSTHLFQKKFTVDSVGWY